uniref:Uncharacterized protein n=1 Tax=Aegilops tauschii subsp. strangulata TaxID=200361 RepID=A0A453MC79_AEGTS
SAVRPSIHRPVRPRQWRTRPGRRRRPGTCARRRRPSRPARTAAAPRAARTSSTGTSSSPYVYNTYACTSFVLSAAAPGQEQASQGGGRLQACLRGARVPDGQGAPAGLRRRAGHGLLRRVPRPCEGPSAQQQHNKARGSVAKQQGGGRRRPPSPTTQALREVQNRLRDECRVIDGCLRANAAGARRRQSFPLFDPSDRQRFPDYPHARPPPSFAECRPFEEEEELGAGHGHQSWCTNGSCESPVYQVRTAPERAARTNRPW